MAVKFGTGGFRAIIGDEFTKENVRFLAQAMVNKMSNEGKTDMGIVIGYDKRFLSKEAMQWMAEVFAGNGVKALLINRSAPTPLVMFYMEKHGFPYGMMVTASHNPAVYNGVKVFTEGGRDANEIQTKDIENYLADIKREDVKSEYYDEAKEAGLIEEIYPLNEYIDAILEKIDLKAIRNAGLRVAIDPMYGVSETSLKTILMTSRCEVFTIHDRHDTLFGGKLPAPTRSTLMPLSNFVIDKGCDIGIATDGDADRIGLIDDCGNFLHPNDILVILYYYLVRYKGLKGPVVRNIATTHMLDKVAEKFGEKCYEVPVGFKHISAKMSETHALIGGESSGGLTVTGHINGKDGIYAASLLIEMLAVTGRKLSEIMAEIRNECGKLYMEERDYKFTPQKKQDLIRLLMVTKMIPEFPYAINRVSYLDGCKVYFENGGWVIARFSGTEPLLRIFCEMENEEDTKMICGIFEEFLELKKKA